MSRWIDPSRWLRGLSAGLVASSLALGGCAGKAEPEATPKQDAPAATADGKPADAAVPAGRDAQHQAFVDAVRNADDPPPDADRPPDETVSKKPVHRILESVREGWDCDPLHQPGGQEDHLHGRRRHERRADAGRPVRATSRPTTSATSSRWRRRGTTTNSSSRRVAARAGSR